MSDERVEELQKELRNRLNLDLAELKNGQSAIMARLDAMNEKFAKVVDVKDLEQRVEKLESNWQKFVGGMIILNFVGGIAIFIINKLWK